MSFSSSRRDRSAPDERQQELLIVEEIDEFLNETRRAWVASSVSPGTIAARYRTCIRFMKMIQEESTAASPASSLALVSELDCRVQRARQNLALLLLQAGKRDAARQILLRLGCLARLSSEILRYTPPSDAGGGESSASELVFYVDDVLPQGVLEVMRRVFAPPGASYWTDHSYCVEPPSPYFSYVVPVGDQRHHQSASQTIMDMAVSGILNAASLKIPSLRDDAKFVEVWAHNRAAYAQHHGLHFDAAEEGRQFADGIRSPLATVVFFVDAPESGTGGPTLVIHQELGATHLGTSGALAFPRTNRCCFFTSNLLHGVIPGRFPPPRAPSRRVTLMFAFWRNIDVRRANSPGLAARPFPTNVLAGDDEAHWRTQLLQTVEPTQQRFKHRPLSAADLKSPAPLSHVFERVLDDAPWRARDSIPAYDQVFQPNSF